MKNLIQLPLLLAGMVSVFAATAATSQDAANSGTTSLPLTSSEKYALLIGVNYTEREAELSKSGLKPLSNAANDAVAFSKVLMDYYGYERANTIVLTDGPDEDDGDPNLPEINEHIKNLRLRVDDDDSILVFFAGHAQKLKRAPVGEQVALLPLDVEFKDREPVVSVGLPDQLFKQVADFHCQHNLIVLDCCYSGEIFNSRGRFTFQPQTKGERSDASLQLVQSFQAIASCRDDQVAGDTPQYGGANSKFMTVFLDGLKYLPIRKGKSRDTRVWANRLLEYVQGGLRSDDSQRPDCRSLSNDSGGNHGGEFCFTPTTEGLAKLTAAAEEELSDGGQLQLQAMIASCQGEWWFDEMPWFIPSIRALLIKQHSTRVPQKRSSAGVAAFVDIDELRKTANAVIRDRRIGDDLTSLRYKHAGLLFQVKNSKQLEKALETIEKDLSERVTELVAEDSHLRAVVLHKLGKTEEAKVAYISAIEKYKEERTRSEQDALTFTAALCCADYGEFLVSISEQEEAVEQFAIAISLVQEVSTNRVYSAFFQVFATGRQADAKAGLREWRASGDLFDKAEELGARDLPGHLLHAHILNRRGWLRMKRWRLTDAQRDFNRSSEILKKHFVKENGKLNHNARITDLHNQHGIAMLTRFKGDTLLATEAYLNLDSTVQDNYREFLASDDHDPAILLSFIDRLINTRERLGDCNLFGDPIEIDPREAFDDYRRALSLVHLLSRRTSDEEDTSTQHDEARDKRRSALLYKQSLALCMDSSIKDTELALRMCRDSDQIYFELGGKRSASGTWQALGELTTLIVEARREATRGNQFVTDSPSQSEKLREGLLRYRDVIGTAPHRDQLEVCLFASKVLLDCTMSDRYHAELNGELLHSFCRVALSDSSASRKRGQAESPAEATCEACSELREYLRPYYDAIVRARLTAGSAIRVKDLIELQAEATTGRPYAKPISPAPVLAIYELGEDCYLFTDIPHGISRCDPITEMYDVSSIRDAIAGRKDPFPLPHQIRVAIQDWQDRTNLTVDRVILRSDRFASTAAIDPDLYSVLRPVLPSPAGDETDPKMKPASEVRHENKFPLAIDGAASQSK
ncbi:Caspase domain protein [Novipirellula galeiformis]|uniref:Caspase domain protein n=1 Tax=Novipirellula galeiformis TaxID=2528004 RepID=A0A5C6CPZ0_9BACT|nr:caspase family protein [Novipirellula galeiformis]TWU24839.1 Caspase domain protein [Novipirellula galeiformis]